MIDIRKPISLAVWSLTLGLIAVGGSGWAIAAATNASVPSRPDADVAQQLTDMNAALKDIRGDLASVRSAINALPKAGAVVAITVRGNPSGADVCQNIQGSFVGSIPGDSTAIPTATVLCSFR